MTPFRLGILSERGSEDPELGELALWAREQPGIETILLARPAGTRRAGAPLALVSALERPLLATRAEYKGRGAGVFAGAPEAADAAAAAAHGLDLLVVGGESALPPGLEDAARLGAVSAALGSGALGRGRAAGFWECLKKEPATGFTLYRHRGDGGEALLSGSFRTRPYHALNRAHVRRKAFAHLRARCAAPPPARGCRQPARGSSSATSRSPARSTLCATRWPWACAGWARPCATACASGIAGAWR